MTRGDGKNFMLGVGIEESPIQHGMTLFFCGRLPVELDFPTVMADHKSSTSVRRRKVDNEGAKMIIGLGRVTVTLEEPIFGIDVHLGEP
jgi:hypothetical protein